MTPLTISSAKIDTYLLDMVALDQGLYAKHNLGVDKFTYPQSGVQGMQLLAAGAAQAMCQDMMLTLATFVNSEKGKRPVVVGSRVPVPTYSIVVGKGSWPATTASFNERMASLKGKKIGVTAVGAGADAQLRLALQAAGMGYDDVTHLAIGNQISAASAQLKAGRIDAYVGITYTFSRMIASLGGGSVLIDFAEPGTPDVLNKQQVEVDVVREDFAQSHQDVVQAWHAVNTEANQWVVANKDKAAALLNTEGLGGQAADLATKFIDDYVANVLPKVQPDFKATKDGIELMISIAVKLGTVKEGQVTYQDLVPEYARA